MIYLGIVIGTVLGGVGGFFISNKLFERKLKLEKQKRPKILRRGVHESEFTSKNGTTGQTSEFMVQFEVGEVERAKDLSKVVVLSLNINDSAKYDMRDKLIEHMDGKWFKQSDIKWIEKTDDQIREDRLDDLLS